MLLLLLLLALLPRAPLVVPVGPALLLVSP